MHLEPTRGHATDRSAALWLALAGISQPCSLGGFLNRHPRLVYACLNCRWECLVRARPTVTGSLLDGRAFSRFAWPKGKPPYGCHCSEQAKAGSQRFTQFLHLALHASSIAATPRSLHMDISCAGADGRVGGRLVCC